MEIVEGALRDTILDFDAALDVLLIRKLHLVIYSGRLLPLAGRQHHSFLLHFVHDCSIIACLLIIDLLLKGQWLVVLIAYVECSIGSSHEAYFFLLALASIDLLRSVQEWVAIRRLVAHRFVVLVVVDELGQDVFALGRWGAVAPTTIVEQSLLVEGRGALVVVATVTLIWGRSRVRII